MMTSVELWETSLKLHPGQPLILHPLLRLKMVWMC